MEQDGQLAGKEQHYTAAHHAHQQKESQRHMQDAVFLVFPTQRVGPGHQAAEGQRQACGGDHHQKIIDIIGHIEVSHTFLIQKVSQGDLIQRADDLGHRHGTGQHRCAADEILPRSPRHGFAPFPLVEKTVRGLRPAAFRLFQHIFMEGAERREVCLPLILALDILRRKFGVKHPFNAVAPGINHLGGSAGTQ